MKLSIIHNRQVLLCSPKDSLLTPLTKMAFDKGLMPGKMRQILNHSIESHSHSIPLLIKKQSNSAVESLVEEHIDKMFQLCLLTWPFNLTDWAISEFTLNQFLHFFHLQSIPFVFQLNEAKLTFPCESHTLFLVPNETLKNHIKSLCEDNPTILPKVREQDLDTLLSLGIAVICPASTLENLTTAEHKQFAETLLRMYLPEAEDWPHSIESKTNTTDHLFEQYDICQVIHWP